MKTIKLNTLKRNIFLGVFAMMIILSFDSCTKKVDFLVSTVEPAARGTVQIKTDNNNNYVIKIQLSDLAEVKRLQPPKQSYVVWMVSDQNITKNIGQINSSTSLLSNKLEANFKTVSTLKPTKIFITAEVDPNVQNPGEPIVLTTDVF